MNINADQSDTRSFVAGELSLLFSTLTVILLLTVIASIIHPFVDVSRVNEIIAAPDNNFLKPEPLERKLFLTAVFVWPFLLFAFYRAMDKLIIRMKISAVVLNVIDNRLKILLTVAIITLVWLDLSQTDFYIMQKSIADNLSGALIALLTVSVLSITIAGANNSNNRIRKFAWSFLSLIVTILIPVSMLGIVLFSVYDLNVISHTGTYVEHLNAVLHAVVQVNNGKELLVDLTHQYGMYPHFMEPLFKLVGLSMLSFTTVMGMLTGFALLLVYRFMKEICEHKLVAGLGFCALIYYGYFFTRINYNFDQYFQYHPIRFLFPAASIFLSYRYFKSESSIRYYSMFLLCSIAVYWNLDTGLVVYGSWVLALFYKELSGRNYKNLLKHSVTAISVFMLFSAAFNLYLYLRYGSVPDYASFLDYQQIFYTYGYAMLPMQLFGPWNLVIGVYVTGLLCAIAGFVAGGRLASIKDVMIFYLSILGVGLFAYYQGRSHDLNLAMVSYPSIIMSAIFADSLYTAFNTAGRRFERCAFYVLMAFFLFCTISLMKNAPDIFADTRGRLRLAINGDIAPTNTRAEFVRQQTRRGGEMLILSSLSGIYYMVSGTSCPIKIPGPTELFLKDDYSKIYEYINSNRCSYLIYDSNFIHSNPHKRKIVDAINERYVIAAASPDGSIFLLKKRDFGRGLPS